MAMFFVESGQKPPSFLVWARQIITANASAKWSIDSVWNSSFQLVKSSRSTAGTVRNVGNPDAFHSEMNSVKPQGKEINHFVQANQLKHLKKLSHD